MAGRLGKGGETVLRTRYNGWNASGVFDAAVEEALAGYDRIVGIDLSDASVDGSCHKAPCGGEGTGKSPVDRGKSGWKWSILCDRDGIPVAWAADAANANDQTMLAPTLADAARRGLHLDIETLHLDRGYQGEPVRRTCLDYGIDDIARAQAAPRQSPQRTKARPAGHALGHRTDQLLAVELRTTTPQHRPQHQSTPRTNRTRHRLDHHHQTLQMGRPMEPQLTTNPRAL